MQDREYRTVDKSQWGEGPWQNEPDKMQFTDKATGLPCLIKRNFSGALCGYVGVTEDHPLFGKSYYDVEDSHPVTVHGGLTYSDRCQPGNEAEGICHVPGPGEPDHVWWFGFDCNHGGDLAPGSQLRGMWNTREAYRDVPYVKDQIRRLAAQLQAVH